MSRPKETEREDIRKLVLLKSKELFIKYGYTSITMRKIAQEIGHSPGSIYLYFKNKNEVFFELFNEGFRLLYNQQLNVMKSGISDPFERLTAMGKEYIRFALENPEYYDLMFMMPNPEKFGENAKSGKGAKESFGMMSFDLFREIVKDCVDAGYYKGVDANTAAFAIWSFAHGIVSLVIRKRLPVQKDQVPKLIEDSYELLTKLSSTI